MAELKRIDFNKPDIVGISGQKYLITQSLNVTRFMEFEKLQIHVGFGVDFQGILGRLKETFELLNKSKPAEAAVHVHNLMNGIAKNLEKRYHPALLLCTLFVVTKDEDLTQWDEAKAMEKIDDWKEYEVSDFFSLAANLVSGFIPVFQELSQNTFKKEKQPKNTIKSSA